MINSIWRNWRSQPRQRTRSHADDVLLGLHLALTRYDNGAHVAELAGASGMDSDRARAALDKMVRKRMCRRRWHDHYTVHAPKHRAPRTVS